MAQLGLDLDKQRACTASRPFSSHELPEAVTCRLLKVIPVHHFFSCVNPTCPTPSDKEDGILVLV